MKWLDILATVAKPLARLVRGNTGVVLPAGFAAGLTVGLLLGMGPDEAMCCLQLNEHIGGDVLLAYAPVGEPVAPATGLAGTNCL